MQFERVAKFGRSTWDKVSPMVDKTIGRNPTTRIISGGVGLILLFVILNFMGIHLFDAIAILAVVSLGVVFYAPSYLAALVKSGFPKLRKEVLLGSVGLGWLVSAIILAILIHEWDIPFRWLLAGLVAMGVGSFFLARRWPSAARWFALRGVPGFLALAYVPILLTLRPVEFSVIKTETVMERYRVHTDLGPFENIPNPFLGYFRDAELQGKLEAGAGQRFRAWKTGFRFATAKITLFPKVVWAEPVSSQPPFMPAMLVEVLTGVIGIPALVAGIVWLRARKTRGEKAQHEVGSESADVPDRMSLLPERLRRT